MPMDFDVLSSTSLVYVFLVFTVFIIYWWKQPNRFMNYLYNFIHFYRIRSCKNQFLWAELIFFSWFWPIHMVHVCLWIYQLMNSWQCYFAHVFQSIHSTGFHQWSCNGNCILIYWWYADINIQIRNLAKVTWRINIASVLKYLVTLIVMPDHW